MSFAEFLSLTCQRHVSVVFVIEFLKIKSLESHTRGCHASIKMSGYASLNKINLSEFTFCFPNNNLAFIHTAINRI